MARTGVRFLRLAWLIGVALLGASTPALSQTHNLTLVWDPNTEPTVAGYRIYAGLSSGLYTLPTQSVPAGQTTFVFAATLGVRYYFAVTAFDTAGFESPFSAEVSDLVPVDAFTDDPLIPGVHMMRAVHITELRGRIDALRKANGLPATGWTDPTLSTAVAVRAIHVREMRSALNEVYARRSLPPPTYSDSNLGTGTTVIKAAHIIELRAAVLALP
jgi:hypothetical protein